MKMIRSEKVITGEDTIKLSTRITDLKDDGWNVIDVEQFTDGVKVTLERLRIPTMEERIEQLEAEIVELKAPKSFHIA